MSAPSRVLRHPRAERDIEEQVDYYLVVERVPEVAARFVDAIEEGFAQLARHSDLGARLDVGIPGLADLRRWHVPGFRNHLIFYRPLSEGVVIVRVLHGAQNLELLFRGPATGDVDADA